MKQKLDLESLTNDELIERLSVLTQKSRRVETELIAHIGEVDHRRLYARFASSMFVYCRERLHFSEHEAYLRIEVARASRRHPVLLKMLADGRLHLSGIVLLHRHMTEENRESLLKRAAYRSKREIEELIAELAPQPDVPATMRKLPGSKTAVQRRRGKLLVPERVAAIKPDRTLPAPAPTKPPMVKLLERASRRRIPRRQRATSRHRLNARWWREIRSNALMLTRKVCAVRNDGGLNFITSIPMVVEEITAREISLSGAQSIIDTRLRSIMAKT